MNKQTFQIPEGCKAISMEIIDNAIVTTFEPEKMEIVELKYIPKVGDCVKVKGNEEDDEDIFYFQCGGVDKDNDPIEFNNTRIKNNVVEFDSTDYGYVKDGFTFTKITPEELQSEFNKLGYEYDFETHEAKKMKWKPNVGETYYYITNHISVDRDYYNSSVDELRYQAGNCFQTEAEAQKFKEYILAYEPQTNN